MSVVKNKSTGKWDTWFYLRESDGSLKKTAKKGFKTKKEAVEYENKHKHQKKELSEISFMDVFDLSVKNSYAKKVTKDEQKRMLQLYAQKLLYMPIIKIEKENILDWRAELSEMDLATGTRNLAINVVRQVLKQINIFYGLEDLSKFLKLFRPELEDMHEMTIINYDQFCRLVDAEEDETYKIFFQLLFMTGCRKGEARALYKEDFDGKNIHIYKAMRRSEDSLSTTKTKKSRYVALDDDTAEKLKRLCEREGKYLFGDYAPLSLYSIFMHFKHDLKIAGLPDMRIHDLRHSNVSLLWAAGVPIPEISKRLGHINPRITMDRYAHVFDRDQTRSLEVLNGLKK